MFCKSCGNQVDDDSTFCSFCGAKQPDANRPHLESAELIGKIASQTVNVNLSFGRPASNIKKTQAFVQAPNKPKYDLTYKKEIDATLFGILLLIFAFGGIIYSNSITNRDSFYEYRTIASIASLFARVIAIVWIINIAKRQNRAPFGWGIFAFFLPSIALITIGQLRKLNIQNYNSDMISDDNSKIIADTNLEKIYESKTVDLNPENQNENESDEQKTQPNSFDWTLFIIMLFLAVGFLCFIFLNRR